MSMKFTPVGATKGHLQIGSGLPIEIDTAGNLSVPGSIDTGGNIKSLPATEAGDVVVYEQAFGVGQTLQDVRSERAGGVIYTNTSGKPLCVFIGGAATATTGYLRGYVGEDIAIASVSPNEASGLGVFFIVPPGHTYRVVAASANITSWLEY